MKIRWINGALAAVLLAYGIGSGTDAAGANDRFPSSVAAGAQRSPGAVGDRKPDTKAQKIYASTCRTCHDPGLLDAPRVGNREEWGPRISKGRDLLLKHTIDGFQKMPPRGGRPSLTNKELALVLDYMLAQSR